MSKYATVLFSLGCRGVQILSSLVVVRYLVGMLGVETYGVWVTLVSVLAWMGLFDFGIGYGVKNRISEFSATGRTGEMRHLVSAALAFYALVALALWLLFVAGGAFFEPFASYWPIAILLFTGASLSFLFSLGGIVLQGLGKFKTFYALNLLQPMVWFGLVLVSRHGHWSLLRTASIYTVAMLLQALAILWVGAASVGGFQRMKVQASIGFIRPLFKTGFGFLLLQLANLALYMSGNFIIYNSLGAVDTAKYDILNKIFQFFGIGFSIVVNIAWTEISKSKAIENHSRKKRVFLLLTSMSVAATAVSCVFAVYAHAISAFLTKGRVVVDSEIALYFVPLVLVQSLAYSGAVFLNAYEELKVQNVLSVFAVPVFSAVAYLLLRGGAMQASIPLASALATLPAMCYCLIRGYKLACHGKKH